MTSSRVTWPSLSRSRISNASRISRTFAVGSLRTGSRLSGACLSEFEKNWLSTVDAPLLLLGVRVGEVAFSRREVGLWRWFEKLEEAERGEVVVFASLVGDESGVNGLAGEVKGLVGDVGVVGRRTLDGDAGDSGRRKGDVRGEPYESGEGL